MARSGRALFLESQILCPLPPSGIASWPQGQHTEYAEASQGLVPVQSISLLLQGTYSSDLRLSGACSVVGSAEGYRVVIILEASLKQDLFAKCHDMRDPGGKEQCKWHL